MKKLSTAAFILWIISAFILLTPEGRSATNRILENVYQITFKESGGSDKITMTTPALGSSYTLTLPATAGTANYPMLTNGSGALSFAQLPLSTSVTGVLPLANGGTNNGSLSVSAGAAYYADGSKLVALAPGTSGQLYTSGGTGAATWTTANAGTYSPTVTAGTNISATGTANCQYSLFDTVWTISCRVPATCTTAGGTASSFTITLPTTPSSNFANSYDAVGYGGTAPDSGGVFEYGLVYAVTGTKTVRLNFICNTVTALTNRWLIFQSQKL